MNARILLLFSTLLLNLPAVSSAPVASELQIEKSSYEKLSEEFYAQIISPAALTISIKDQATLEKAIEKLNISKKRISALAKEFQKLPLPSDEAKDAINKLMEKKEEQLESEMGEKFFQHLRQMPPNLKDSWNAELKDFYMNLDKHKDVFNKYF